MFGQNKAAHPHENDMMGMRESPSVNIPQHLQEANGFTDHIINAYPNDQQNEILLHIQKRMIEHRRNVLSELELQIKASQQEYEKIQHALNVIS